MGIREFGHLRIENVLFVWDGTSINLSHADNALEKLGVRKVHVVHAMPHESIYGYGAVLRSDDESCLTECHLRRAYRSDIVRTKNLKSTKLSLLFGDRVSEIARFANERKVDLVLASKFHQSTFSLWLHGDLNQRLQSKLQCPLILINQRIDANGPTADFHQAKGRSSDS